MITALPRRWMKAFALAFVIHLAFDLAAVSAAQEMPFSFAGLVKKAGPGVVNIMVTKLVKDAPQEQTPLGPDDPFRDFFNLFYGDRMPREYRQGNLGTGFIIDRDGFILTNYHVIENATELKVKLADNREYMATIVGKDPKTDLALVRITAGRPMPPLPLGDSDRLEVGDWVVAIGNPFGLGNTVTSGIVSAKYRQIGAGTYDNFIQTDASINPGNSGGPLLNMAGEVIGINSAIFSESGGSVGIGFAIPINLAKELLPQLREGRVRRSYLGVMVQEITPELEQQLNLSTNSGALVSDVAADGPAGKAGVQRGDVIVAFDGKAVRSARDLPQIVASTPIGQKVAMEVMRRKDKLELQATTQEMVEDDQNQPPVEGPQIGLALQALNPEIAKHYGLARTKGLLITQVEEGSPAADAGLASGDIIAEAGQRFVADLESFRQIVAEHPKGGTLLLLIDRGGTTTYATLALP